MTAIAITPVLLASPTNCARCGDQIAKRAFSSSHDARVVFCSEAHAKQDAEAGGKALRDLSVK